MKRRTKLVKHGYFLLVILFLLFVFTLGEESRADVGDTRETATDLALDTPYTETVDADDDDDYFRIKVNKSGKLRAWTTRNVDTFGELYDSSGAKIGENDDGGRRDNFRMVRNVEPGTYFLKVEPYDDRYVGKKYTVQATLEPGNYVLDVGDTRETATALALDTPYTDETILSGEADDDIDDVDYFRIEVDQSGKLTVWTTGDQDTYGELEDNSGTRIATDDDKGRGNNFKMVYFAASGTYYLKVTGLWDDYEQTYTVHATLEPGEIVVDAGGTRETATLLALDTPHTEGLEFDDTDYFRIEVAQSGKLTVWTTGDQDTYGELEDSSGTRIATDDDSGPGDNFSIIHNVEPGTYYLEVFESFGDSGIYTVHATLGAATVIVDAGDTRETATLLALDTPHTETFESDDDIDYYRIEIVDQSAQLTVWTTGDHDTYGELEDSSGARIAENDDSELLGNFRIVHNVEPGAYYLKVAMWGVGVQRFTYTVHATLELPEGPKIEGPWLWTLVPIGDSRVPSGIDYLAEASGGTVTETAIATDGVPPDSGFVGDRKWLPGRIAPTANNINSLMGTIGLATDNTGYHVAYGSIALEVLHEQKTLMYVQGDSEIKVWFNGVLVYHNSYPDFFPITLKEGENILLVAIYEETGDWTGFFRVYRRNSL